MSNWQNGTAAQRQALPQVDLRLADLVSYEMDITPEMVTDFAYGQGLGIEARAWRWPAHDFTPSEVAEIKERALNRRGPRADYDCSSACLCRRMTTQEAIEHSQQWAGVYVK